MASLRNYTRSGKFEYAFTLFEVLLVITILSAVLAATLFVTTSMYQSEVLRTERAMVVQLLLAARSTAQNGQYGAAHGVAFNPPGFVGYVTFVGDSLTGSGSDTRQFIPSAPSVTIASGTIDEVVFLPVSGDVHTPGVVRLIDKNRPAASTTITINEIGYVGW